MAMRRGGSGWNLGAAGSCSGWVCQGVRNGEAGTPLENQARRGPSLLEPPSPTTHAPSVRPLPARLLNICTSWRCLRMCAASPTWSA